MWGGNECMHVRSEDEYCIVWHNIILGITILQFGRPEVNVCFRFPESLFRMRVGRSEPRYLVPSQSVSNSKSSALHNRNACSSTTCYSILARAQTE